VADRITAALDSAYDCDCRDGWGEFGDALRAYAHRVALMVLGEVIAWGEGMIAEGSEG